MAAKIEIRDGYDPTWIDEVMALHNRTEMKRNDAIKVSRAFQASYAVASCWSDGQLLGIGRMISDGEMYSGIFDVVIDPGCQKQGLGRLVMERLISKAPGTCVHLTSTFGNEAFYGKLGFKKHRTAMALYPEPLKMSPYLVHDEMPQK